VLSGGGTHLRKYWYTKESPSACSKPSTHYSMITIRPLWDCISSIACFFQLFFLRFVFLSFFFARYLLLLYFDNNLAIKVSRFQSRLWKFLTLTQTYRFMEACYYGHRRSSLDDMQEGKRSLYFNRLGHTRDLVLLKCGAIFAISSVTRVRNGKAREHFKCN